MPQADSKSHKNDPASNTSEPSSISIGRRDRPPPPSGTAGPPKPLPGPCATPGAGPADLILGVG